MRLRLPLVVLAFAAGVTLGACDIQTSQPEQEAPPPAPVEAPAVEDVAEEASAPAEAEPAQQAAPPPSDTGDMGDARPSEESVQPDSETVFY